MPRPKRFTVELVEKNCDGTPSDLTKDLETNAAKRIIALNRLTEDFIWNARPLFVPPGEEGQWISVKLDKYGEDVAMCQWDPGERSDWDLQKCVGRLKVVRIISKWDKDAYREFVEELRGDRA